MVTVAVCCSGSRVVRRLFFSGCQLKIVAGQIARNRAVYRKVFCYNTADVRLELNIFVGGRVLF